MLTGLHIHLSALGARLGHFFKSSVQGYQRHSHKSFLPVVLCDCNQMRVLDFAPPPPPTQHGSMLFRVAVIHLPVNNWQNPHWKKSKKTMQAAESLQPHEPLKCLQQLNLTTTAPLLHPHETSPTLQKMKNGEYYDFTHSCQKDINRIQLERRLDTEILLCAVNKRPALSRRAALMRCYEGECIEEQGRQTFTL